MAKVLTKIARTAQVNFPFLQDLKFRMKRTYREITKVPCEDDFYALPLIKGVDEMLFIDIGANRGETIQAIKQRAKSGRIVGFEPNPLVFDKLQRTYAGDPTVELYNLGLGQEPAELELNIPFYKDFMYDGLASFNAEEALGWLQSRIYFFKNSDLTLRKVFCKIGTLDSFDLSPDFIKIDVQGFEYNVLLGAKETIERTKPIFLIETPTEQVSSYLIQRNYLPFKYQKGSGLAPGYGSLNTFFFESGKSKSLILSD